MPSPPDPSVPTAATAAVRRLLAAARPADDPELPARPSRAPGRRAASRGGRAPAAPPRAGRSIVRVPTTLPTPAEGPAGAGPFATPAPRHVPPLAAVRRALASRADRAGSGR